MSGRFHMGGGFVDAVNSFRRLAVWQRESASRLAKLPLCRRHTRLATLFCFSGPFLFCVEISLGLFMSLPDTPSEALIRERQARQLVDTSVPCKHFLVNSSSHCIDSSIVSSHDDPILSWTKLDAVSSYLLMHNNPESSTVYHSMDL